MKKPNRKRCPKCLRLKPLGDFKSRPSGSAAGYCKRCELVYFKTYNAKRYASTAAREAEAERSKAKYHADVKPARVRRKLELIRRFGGQCQQCGYKRNLAALDFHHSKGEKLRTISHLLASQDPEAFRAASSEAEKCELLCSNCHREATFPDLMMRNGVLQMAF